LNPIHRTQIHQGILLLLGRDLAEQHRRPGDGTFRMTAIFLKKAQPGMVTRQKMIAWLHCPP